LDPTGLVLATTTSSGLDGTYTLQPATNLNPGTTALRVRVRDAAGNMSPAGPALILTVADAATGDYDGVGHAELAVYNVATGQWYVNGPTGGRYLGAFGAPGPGDIPVPGDYDGVGRAEMAVYHVATGQWYVNGPTGGRYLGAFGAPDLVDLPTTAPTVSLNRRGLVGGLGVASPTVGPDGSIAREFAQAPMLVAPPSSSAQVVTTRAPARTKRPAKDGEAVLAAAMDGLTAERAGSRRRVAAARM
ncbi:MAG: hypothetical protein LC745_13700, partial [Planctomycetia bacterium]|nr:hypothetical protein [Planctomycetia bacterium]